MTPISEMTNEELDRYIAELRGWKTVEVTSAFSLTAIKNVWIDPLGYAENLPHPTADPRYAMELLEDIAQDKRQLNPILEYFHGLEQWGVCAYMIDWIYRDNKFRAISDLYAHVKGEK